MRIMDILEKLDNIVNELASEYGKGITFVDIDESIFHTFAKIKVIKDGKVVKELSNQEFNTYEKGPGEEYDFSDFRDAEFFRKTSIPVKQTVKRLQRMFKNIGRRGSKVVLLTARAPFKNMKEFKEAFRDHNIPIDKIDDVVFYKKNGPSVAQYKKKTIMDYLKTGEYRRVRLVDDAPSNLKQFLSLKYDIPDNVIEKVKKKHGIKGEESLEPIEFYALLVKPDGSLQRMGG